MNPSESQNLDAASQRIVRDMDKITKGKLPWEDSQEYVTEGLGHLVVAVDKADKEVKSMHQTVKSMPQEITDLVVEGMNGNKAQKEKDVIIFERGKIKITAKGKEATKTVGNISLKAMILVIIVWGFLSGPSTLKKFGLMLLCEFNHGSDCSSCLDHPH